jgi:hypothetical protein
MTELDVQVVAEGEEYKIREAWFYESPYTREER